MKQEEGYIIIIGSRSKNPNYLHIGFCKDPVAHLVETQDRVPDDILLFSLLTTNDCAQRLFNVLSEFSVAEKLHPSFNNFNISLRAAIDAIMFVHQLSCD